MEREACLQGILHISQKLHLSGFPSKEALLQSHLHGIPCRQTPHHQSPSSFICQSPRIRGPPPHTRFPSDKYFLNPLNAELNPIRYLLALLGAHHILHVSRIRDNHIPKHTASKRNKPHYKIFTALRN